MKVYSGIDVIEVERIKENIEKYEGRFLNKIYTKKEIEYCESKGVQKYQSYAGKFAAKEAAFKAISNLLNNKYDIEWKDIEINNDKNGRPFVCLYTDLKNNIQIDVSISHIETVAVANVLIIIN